MLRPPVDEDDLLARPLFGVLQPRPVDVDRRHHMVPVMTQARSSRRELVQFTRPQPHRVGVNADCGVIVHADNAEGL